MRTISIPLMLALGLCLQLAHDVNAGEIRWQSGTVQNPSTTPEDTAQAIVALAANRTGAARAHVVVQFDAPLTEAEKTELAAAGMNLLTYLGDHAFYASVAPDAVDAQRLASVSKLRAAIEPQPVWKLHRTLAAGEIAPWALADANPADFEANPELRGIMILPAADENPTVAAYVLFHPDVDFAGEGANIVQRHGAVIRDVMFSVNGLVIELPYRSIADLAAEDAVQYIEPPLPKFSVDNSSNRARTGADLAQAAPYNLDGSGVSVLVYDGGTGLSSHADFGGRLFVRDTSGLSDHATHVSGTIGGSGLNSAGLHRGMAPGVTIQSYGFETGGPLEAGFLYTNPGDLEADYNQAINTYGADISNNSIGTNVAPNGFPCSWEGDYNVTDALIDAIARGSLGAPFRIVWAGGNERGNGRCGTTYNTIAPPAGAKNHLSVGALNSNNDTVTSFTGWGPTDDGRLKPDFAGPGCQSDGDGGVTSTSSAGSYNVKCGTSMSSPTVCGISSLILQDFRANNPGDPDFRNSTLKAVLAHTAVDIEAPGPDYRSGYGSVRVVPAIDLMRAGNFLESQLVQDQTVQFLVIVAPSDTQLKVTLAWDDVPGTPAVNPTLINDLDLRVLDANSNAYFPWTLNPAVPSANAVRTQADHANNLEQVVIDAPAPGAYLVQVTGFNVPQGPQTFSLAASPLLINCSPQGVLRFNQDNYSCAATVEISVNDCDVNTNDFVIDTVQITVASDTEPGGEVITLVETSPQSAFFTGSISVATTDAVGVLHITEGDTVTATYIDADDGFGNFNVVVQETVGIDCTPPFVSNVAAIDIDPRSATITFNTDEPALGTVYYGTDCLDLADSAGAFGFNTAHAIALTDLQDDTPYFYGIEAIDDAGNATFDTNGGACYTFATPEIPDYFTQDFLGDFDLANRAILFAPNGSVDFYGACTFETVALPTDPAGGNNVLLTDAASVQVNLTGGAQVLVYGVSYNSFFINANGNITFTAADNDQTETFADHFDTPRISAFFDDLDPSEGGTVSWKQLSNRAVVTWLNVPEDNGNNQNTFQVEMYYDGRIQLIWLTMAAADSIVGLSAGGGVPIDFFESDLSAAVDCGPRPPSAAGRTVITGQDRPISFTLLASDDGLPDPPATLNYIITSLPVHDLFDAGNGHLILSGELPYTLVGGGNELTYSPDGGFIGLDSFNFKVNDGGVPPDAGDSNLATVVMQVEPVLFVPFFDSFPQTTFDTNKWGLVLNAAIDDVGIAEPSPPYSARINGTPTGGDELRTHLMDLSGVPNVRLVYYFQRTGGGESPDAGENLRVEYLNADGTWVLLAQYAGDGPDMNTYQREDMLLPPAALHDSFRLRFRTTGTSGTGNFDDWFIDDVSLTIGDAPFAAGAAVTVRQDDLAEIQLIGTDPNDDDLDFVIVSLPSGGNLYDPNGGLITSNALPYTLASLGSVVQYQRIGNFLGLDAFEFKVNDGTYDSFVVEVTIRVQPLLEIPFEESFPDLLVNDVHKWAVATGVTIDSQGANIPSPPYAARFNAAPLLGDTLISFPIDLDGFSNIRLRYHWQRTGNGDSPEAGDDLFVEYADSNGAWQLIAQYLGSGVDMTVFDLHDQPLPAAALHGNFQLRFRNIGNSGDDWFVDSILVYHPDAPTASNLGVLVPKFGWSEIALPATDPNTDPLNFHVLSLPAHGALVDMSDGTLITAGALPYTLSSGNQVRYLPILGYVGADAFTFRASDAALNSNVATVSIQVGGDQPVLSFPLDVDPGWSTQGQWAFGQPQGISFDPSSGKTGLNVYGYNLAGKYGPNLPATYLTTTPLNLSNVVNAELRFQRWLGVESSFFDHASVEVSNNGVNWTLIWNHTNVAGLFDRAWIPQSFDVSAVADQKATFYVRWSMGPTDGSGEFEGWNIDDIQIFGDVLAGLGDIDRDGDVDHADLRAFDACLFGPGVVPAPSAPMAAADCLDAFDFDADNDIDLDDFQQFTQAFTGSN